MVVGATTENQLRQLRTNKMEFHYSSFSAHCIFVTTQYSC